MSDHQGKTFDVDTTREEYLAALEKDGIAPENNCLIAGRVPPGTCQGIHPAKFFAIYNNSDLFAALQEALPEPAKVPEMRLAFDTNALDRSSEQTAEPNAPAFNIPRIV